MKNFEITAEEADAMGKALWNEIANGGIPLREMEMAKKLTKKFLVKMADLVIDRRQQSTMRLNPAEIAFLSEVMDDYWESGSPAFRRIFDEIRRYNRG